MSETTVRPPKQKRSQQSLERVLRASLRLLEEKGFERFTIQDVSQEAGVSVGAIYARFGNKESLLRAVHADAMEAMAQANAGVATTGADLRDVVVEAVHGVAAIFRANEKALRAFMHLGAVDDVISRRGSESSVALARTFAATVLAHRDEITHADPELAVDVAYRMAYCTFARQVMYGPVFESDRAIGWRRLAGEVGEACAAYLLQPRPGRG